MSQLLFEIGVEELPALSIEPALAFMRSFAEKSLTAQRLAFGQINTCGTPRRLVITVDDLESKQADLVEEILGPNVKIAFNDDGSLTKAGSGFLASKGIASGDVYKKSTSKGDVIAAKMMSRGRLAAEIVPDILVQMMREIPFQKRMRWDSSGDTFARPVRWLLALLDGQALKITFADVESGDTSQGHRFMAHEEFKVSSTAQYFSEQSRRFVMLNPEDRASSIVAQIKEKVTAFGGVYTADDELLDIVKNLVEYPFVLIGHFEPKYLAIPQEILVSEMRSKQKYFAVYDKSGKLQPHFICVAGVKPYDEAIFAAGNARVLRARFEDGAFYFAKDLEKSLSEHAQGLANLVFERELGTVAQKCERIKNIAHGLVPLLKLDAGEIAMLDKAASLMKADLVCGVVSEFPDLQGIMGGIYAQREGLPGPLCEAIRMHYWPRSAHDDLPKSKLAAALSIADKLDTLVGIIAIGKEPKGNKDPFGLRRAAIGIVRMLMDFGVNVELSVLVKLAVVAHGQSFAKNSSEISQKATDFIVARARGLLLEKLRADSESDAVRFVDSVILAGASNLLDTFTRADALFFMHNQNPAEFHSLIQTFKRAGNIVKKAQESGISVLGGSEYKQILNTQVEQDLIKIVEQTIEKIAMKNSKSDNYEQLCESYKQIFFAVGLIKPKLDAFFDSVMVMVDDTKVRDARLALLGEIKHISDQLADFTHL